MGLTAACICAMPKGVVLREAGPSLAAPSVGPMVGAAAPGCGVSFLHARGGSCDGMLLVPRPACVSVHWNEAIKSGGRWLDSRLNSTNIISLSVRSPIHTHTHPAARRWRHPSFCAGPVSYCYDALERAVLEPVWVLLLEWRQAGGGWPPVPGGEAGAGPLQRLAATKSVSTAAAAAASLWLWQGAHCLPFLSQTLHLSWLRQVHSFLDEEDMAVLNALG